MKHLFKFIVALGVFAMTIGSGFAMDNNPPSEPVKVFAETEIAEDVQPLLFGYGYYDLDTDECMLVKEGLPPTGCSIINSGPICTVNIGGTTHTMLLFTRPNTSSPWICTVPLRQP